MYIRYLEYLSMTTGHGIASPRLLCFCLCVLTLEWIIYEIISVVSWPPLRLLIIYLLLSTESKDFLPRPFLEDSTKKNDKDRKEGKGPRCWLGDILE